MAVKSIKEQIGCKILEARVKRRLTELQLAARAQVHRNTVYRIEAGLNCSIESVWKICKVLGISLDSLFEECNLIDRQLELWPKRRTAQLELWPRRVKRKYEKRLSGDSNGRSIHLLPLRSGLGSERSRAAGM
jgi:DNA-binding XRE family transcriptional regulator